MSIISIFAVPNGVGISRDVALIKDILVAAGHEVDLNHTFRHSVRRKYDLGIHLERFKPELFSESTKNVMVPNQEWFEPAWKQYLSAFDVIYTKTRFADGVFKALGCRTEFISFTSDDRLLPDVPKDDYHWFHLAGKSVQKQTETVIRTWQRNPGFPQLTVLQDPKFYRPRMALRNVNFMFDRLPEGLLKVMQNTFAVHVCPSETEGFGHYIVEAMSCKSIVLTTDGAPMNELVTPEYGVLATPSRSEPLRLSVRHVVNEESLEKAVVKTSVIDEKIRREMGDRARSKFLENDAFFRRRLVEAVANTLEG